MRGSLGLFFAFAGGWAFAVGQSAFGALLTLAAVLPWLWADVFARWAREERERVEIVAARASRWDDPPGAR